MRRQRLCFIIESGTDVRLVEGLCSPFELSVLARRIEGGVEISHKPTQEVVTVVGPSSRLRFALLVWTHLRSQRKQIDLVLVQGYGLTALAANVASRLHHIHATMLVCSPAEAYYRCRRVYVDEGKPYRRREMLMLMLIARLNALIGQRYIVLSDHLAQVVRTHRQRASVVVVPVYGVDTELFSPPEESKVSIKRRLNLPDTGKLIFFSSRIAPEKDSETLLKALRRLLDAGHDLWLLHRSGGYKAFIKKAEPLGIASRIIATDAVHPDRELRLDYQASDLCVQASREEGLGFSPLEALASGLPVVASSVGGLKETIVDGVTGWSYPVGDEIALAKCIEDVLRNPEEAARRAAEGRALVCKKYNRQLVFDRLGQVLLSIREAETGSNLAEAL